LWVFLDIRLVAFFYCKLGLVFKLEGNIIYVVTSSFTDAKYKIYVATTRSINKINTRRVGGWCRGWRLWFAISRPEFDSLIES